jgi:predicted transcriptional regulator
MGKITVPVAMDGHRDYLSLLNGILKLTSVELDVLAAFLEVDPFVCATKNSRKIVVEKLGMKNTAVLNNYVKALKDKGVIYKDQFGNYKYLDIVSPRMELESIEFTITDKPSE